MPSARTTLERIGDRVPVPEPAFERLLRRRDRKRRNQRITAAAVAAILALVSMSILVRSFRGTQGPANEPTPPPSPSGIFSDVGGWIAYGNDDVKQGPRGILAVDPTRPNVPEARIQLSHRLGEPLAWSSDGSSLLIWRTGCQEGPAPCWTGLFVLNADGTETRLVTNRLGHQQLIVGVGPGDLYAGGSFSPDGSQVVFSTSRGIYTVDADGGTPRILNGDTPRILREDVVNPTSTFSPDGTKIAYFYFGDFPGQALRVMNADGTGDRVLLGRQAVNCLRPILLRPVWSPDGTQIAFTCSRETGIRVVDADGSDLTTVIPDGSNPYWSPDGSRIAFEVPIQGCCSVPRRLAIANADGTHVQVFEYPAHAGPWNPLSSSVLGESNPTGSVLASPWVYAVALVVLVGVLFGGRRARGKNASRS
jgi:dipeptidyl aminopeptidase/acylaminoacyl peptidase